MPNFIFLGAGIVLLILGFFVRERRATSLLIGYDPKKVGDEKGLTNFIGTAEYFLGVMTIIFSFLMNRYSILVYVWLGIFVVSGVVIMLQARRY